MAAEVSEKRDSALICGDVLEVMAGLHCLNTNVSIHYGYEYEL